MQPETINFYQRTAYLETRFYICEVLFRYQHSGSNELSHHIGLPGLFDVVCGDDDGDFARLHDLHQMLPDPGEEMETPELLQNTQQQVVLIGQRWAN